MATTEKMKQELQTKNSGGVEKKLPSTIQEWVRVYEKQIAKALPSVLTPERFSRMVLTALTQTPKLQQCTPDSFVGSMLTAAQLGLEPNTPLGQAYLIPYNNTKKDVVECQFQVGYKGLLDLAYRSGDFKCIYAEVVYENDEFEYSLGLDAKLEHKPAKADRGKMVFVYAVYKLQNDGYAFKVMSVEDVTTHGRKYSKSFNNGPWKTNFEEMAKKTVLKQLLKYAPLKTEFARGVSVDEKASVIEFDPKGEEAPTVVAAEYEISDEEETKNYDEETGELTDLTGTPFEEGSKND